MFKNPGVIIFHRAGALDVQFAATGHTALDRNNTLDLVLNPGWNTLKACEVRVKPMTGGLRLLTLEAKVVDSPVDLAKAPEAGGIFHFNAITAETDVTLRFPYSVEQDMGDVSAKIEVSYTLESGEKLYFAKLMSIPISLALGVNVQDVFKQQALFSRFNVSSASQSPLRLHKSELLESDVFESEFGLSCDKTILVFPKQPATLLYKIKRKSGVKSTKRSARTMYLKLYYNVLQTDLEDAIVDSISEDLKATALGQYARVIKSLVAKETKGLQMHDLERAALLGGVPTSFLAEVAWEKQLTGIGRVPGSNDDAAEAIATFLKQWQVSHPQVALPTTQPEDPCTIMIPVEIPSLPILHTADIQIQAPITEMLDQKAGALPTVSTNQMLPATLHLKWTQVWDTEMQHKKDTEYSYEVTAPADTWLLGGRRKGHLVIPGSSGEPLSSTPETEAAISLIMIPLREGWLPYPSIEIREVHDNQDDMGEAVPSLCELDFRNLGESVRVVSDKKGVTISLDASGPGGGPLIMESEALGRERGRIVA